MHINSQKRDWRKCANDKERNHHGWNFASHVGLWIFGGMLNVDVVTAAILGLSVLLITRVVTWKECLAEFVAWDTLTWFATLIAIAGYLNTYGLISSLSHTSNNIKHNKTTKPYQCKLWVIERHLNSQLELSTLQSLSYCPLSSTNISHTQTLPSSSLSLSLFHPRLSLTPLSLPSSPPHTVPNPLSPAATYPQTYVQNVISKESLKYY
ncbi:hypothetical protein L2E82_33068 [Cichorium intybus]|uniref:Uncharacterized protein n=1 Tax=Cichorium intybus TaxID=13427 RepID=A0ACB9BJ67_CICIN|nr:hypothetical protein L2E82_33068 [Cichorium intybus]